MINHGDSDALDHKEVAVSLNAFSAFNLNTLFTCRRLGLLQAAKDSHQIQLSTMYKITVHLSVSSYAWAKLLARAFITRRQNESLNPRQSILIFFHFS